MYINIDYINKYNIKNIRVNVYKKIILYLNNIVYLILFYFLYIFILILLYYFFKFHYIFSII